MANDGYVRVRGMTFAEMLAVFDAAGITYEPYGLTLRVTHVPEGVRVAPRTPAPATVASRDLERRQAAPEATQAAPNPVSFDQMGDLAAELADEVSRRIKGTD